jgi:hypothetical protein
VKAASYEYAEAQQMQIKNRFVRETKLFEALLPALLKTDSKKWFVAWGGERRGVFDRYEAASDFIAHVPRDTNVLVREITEEEIRLPFYFLTA